MTISDVSPVYNDILNKIQEQLDNTDTSKPFDSEASLIDAIANLIRAVVQISCSLDLENGEFQIWYLVLISIQSEMSCKYGDLLNFKQEKKKRTLNAI